MDDATVDVAEGRRLLREAEETSTGDLEEWVANNLDALLDSAEHLNATIAERDALKAEAERLREALHLIADSAGPFRERGTSGDGQARCIDIAAAALKPQEPDHAR